MFTNDEGEMGELRNDISRLSLLWMGYYHMPLIDLSVAMKLDSLVKV